MPAAQPFYGVHGLCDMQAQPLDEQLPSSSAAVGMLQSEPQPRIHDSSAGQLGGAGNSPASAQLVEMPLPDASQPEEHEAENFHGAEVRAHASM